MNPISRNTLSNSIATVQKYLKSLELFSAHSWIAIENDQILRGAYERYVSLLLQSTLDLADASISFKKFRKPTSYAEAFEILHENGLISPALQEKLRLLAKLRNAMTHDYAYLKPEDLEEVRTSRYKDIEEFVAIIEKL